MSVVGYQYAVDNLCPSCTIAQMRANGIKVAKGPDHESAIRRAAERQGVDFSDEGSYDSGDFPKTITTQQAKTELTELPDGERGEISDERCDVCHKWLILGEKSPSEARLSKWVREEYELPHALAKLVAAELREWGLSHPEFIDSDNAAEAAARHPHDFRSVQSIGGVLVLVPTPNSPTDTCMDCRKPWEAHRFHCDVCKAEVSATDHHSHAIQVKGQLQLR
ncbi:hypothetical protein [Streptomyces chattanoogensis]|uniref:hypothetical protein n=1 Tax=Streptomyces chattanoogensis TaxID=66876 RepID=UPI0036971EE1